MKQFNNTQSSLEICIFIRYNDNNKTSTTVTTATVFSSTISANWNLCVWNFKPWIVSNSILLHELFQYHWEFSLTPFPLRHYAFQLDHWDEWRVDRIKLTTTKYILLRDVLQACLPQHIRGLNVIIKHSKFHYHQNIIYTSFAFAIYIHL